MAERTDLTITTPDQTGGEDRSAEEIRHDIAAKRESITRTVGQINDKVQRTLDWRTYAGEYPFVTLGLAVGAGVLVAQLFRPKPSPGDRILDAIAESVEDIGDRFNGYLDVVPKKKSGAATAVKSALAAWLTKAATDYVKDRLLAGGQQRQVDSRQGDSETQIRAQGASV